MSLVSTTSYVGKYVVHGISTRVRSVQDTRILRQSLFSPVSGTGTTDPCPFPPTVIYSYNLLPSFYSDTVNFTEPPIV